ncbi:regulatory protein SoxS [Abditibacteriota bacterium]|nr:regulatory protein SoxS [Abditibacteriota bacterium]
MAAIKQFYRYLPLSDNVRERDLYVIAGGIGHIPPHTSYPPGLHPADHSLRWQNGRVLQEYQLIYIAQGGGVFQSQSAGVRRIGAGTLFGLFPSEWHRYSPDQDTGWDEYWVAFQGRTASNALAECRLSPEEPVVEIGIHGEIVEEFLQISREMHEEAAGHQPVMAARTLLIMALVSSAILRDRLAETDLGRITEKAKCLLLERTNQPVNMQDLAAELNVGYSWFRRMFRQSTGLSPAQYHQQLRLNRACEQLRATTLPIALISQDLGFDSPEYFARIFKAKINCSPREYRNMSQAPPIPPSEIPGRKSGVEG